MSPAASLRPYQIVGRDFLADRRAALLADEMRLGKCAQSIAACESVKAHTITVVCPASVCETWRREFRKWWPEGDYALEVWSYDMAAKGHAHRWCGSDVLILDEAHYLKSPKAKRTEAILGKKCDGAGGLAAQAERVFLLTGTPMPNNPSELWPMLRAFAPELIKSPRTGKPWTLWQFVNKFCKTQYNPHAPATPKIVGAKNHAELNAKLEGFMLRRTLAEVKPEVPAMQIESLYVESSPDRGLLASNPDVALVRRALQEHGVDGLRRVAAHVATLRRLTGLAKVAPVVAWVKDWLEGCDGKIVLFAQHTDVLLSLKQALAYCAFVAGDTPTSKRQDEVDFFRQEKECSVFIGQLQAAGTGIDLSAARDVLFVESSWVPAENAQAANRIVSLQDPQPRMARFATLAGSIDEDISAAVRRKTADILRIVG